MKAYCYPYGYKDDVKIGKYVANKISPADAFVNGGQRLIDVALDCSKCKYRLVCLAQPQTMITYSPIEH